ncbi:MAG TPA: hypothetical protein PKY82_01975 [Pyrinomonadaceae bacterium]|nr:hypothetical protein [Pyrinomonadaceae bacterium]
MKNILKSASFAFSILFLAGSVFGQVNYSGFIGEAPVTMVTNIYSDGVGTATYVYDNFDEPIRLEAELVKKKLIFTEKNARNLKRATLTFENFDAGSAELKGVWKDAKTGKTLDIKLKKDFEVDGSAERELIQSDSLPDRYFKVVVSGDSAVAVKIFEKKTDRLLQKIDLGCQQRGAESISIDDYNFDGIKDFSIFESSYAGPNTSRLYYLYDPAAKKFIESDFTGTSLEFDAKTKTITETNQCCAGASIITATYKVVKNKMVLIKEHCLKWDEKRKKHIERPIKQCQ